MADEPKKLPKATSASALEAFLSEADKPRAEQKAINPFDLEKEEEDKLEIEEPTSGEPDIYADLSEEEKEAIKKQARAKVAEQLREAKRKAYLKEQINYYQRKARPGQEEVQATIDLPGHADRIVLDGTHYFHGVTYTFNLDQYRTVADISARAWEHEHEVGGANRDVYRAPRNVIITPNSPNGAVASKPLPMVKF
jgi:hypothetical protein